MERPAAAARARPGRRGNLVQTVEAALRDAISSGEVPTGGRLPSESALTLRYGVSRTVIREAVSSLRLSGLVEARQGVGVFVAAAPPPDAPAAAFRVADPRRLSAVIELLELRVAVEVEAAGLAAARRSPAQAEAVRERWEDFRAAVEAGRANTAADLGFHLAVADATNNPQFRRILEMMGRSAIPRSALALGRRGPPSPKDEQEHETLAAALVGPPTEYFGQIEAEHRRIADAVDEGDADRARAAMRDHLEGSMDRYRALLRRE